jgi:hypothetical protein
MGASDCVSSMLPTQVRRGRAWMTGNSFLVADYQFNTHLSSFVFSFFAKYIFLVEK